MLDRVSASISVDPLASLQVAQPVNDPGAPVSGDNEATTTTENNQLPLTVEETSQTCTLDREAKGISLVSFVGSLASVTQHKLGLWAIKPSVYIV